MIYVLYGEDSFSIREKLEEIKRGLGDPSLVATNTTVLDGEDLTTEDLRKVCETFPFFMAKRLVIIEGLLDRFETRGKAPARGQKNNKEGKDEVKPFADCIRNTPESTVLIITGDKRYGSNPLLKEIARAAQVKYFPFLRSEELTRWVQKRVAQTGGSISQSATSLLAGLVGSDLWVMTNEINKLVIFTSGQRIEEEDVRKVVGYTREMSIFALVDAILELRAGEAQKSLQTLLVGGDTAQHVISMVARQIQFIIRAKEMKSLKKSESEIQSNLALASPYALRKVLSQAQKYSIERLKEVYRKLLETDLAIKTGKYDTELALDLFITELAGRV